jgi:phenylalanyl-tRNA synthetase alpha chain
MENENLPIRMMVLDRCFRYENLDARHEHTFDQFELVYIDKGLSMANLQYLSEYFLKSVLGKDIKVRMRPKYYPFVEPGVGIDGECMFCNGQGCKICGGVGWLELGGAGMIHPNVLRNGGIDPDVYSGIAWGPGLERILLLKYGIEDVRLFRNADLRFLDKF